MPEKKRRIGDSPYRAWVGPQGIRVEILDRLCPEHRDKAGNLPRHYKRYNVMVNNRLIRRVANLGTARGYARLAADAVRAATGENGDD